MTFTESSEALLSVKNLKVEFDLEYFQNMNLREVFVSVLAHPIDFFFRRTEHLQVLSDVSFELTRGMRLGLIGLNGSGKTTLCRCLAGMMFGQSGSVSTEVNVTAIFDTGTGIFPELTGRENAYLLGRLFYPAEENLEPLVEEALAFSELGHFVDFPFRQYSKGMQSRLILSLISSRPAEVLVLDEVFDGADHIFRKKLAERMKSFINRTGATVFVSHSFEQLRELCTHLMVLDKGRISFIGNVEEGLDFYLRNTKGA